jgi:hypothetical protein
VNHKTFLASDLSDSNSPKFNSIHLNESLLKNSKREENLTKSSKLGDHSMISGKQSDFSFNKSRKSLLFSQRPSQTNVFLNIF